MQVSLIEFGEKDAKNVVFKDRRGGRSVFKASFQMPPGIDFDKLVRGENYFIIGQKGCGKTALMLYVQEIAQDRGWSTDTVLFRTGLSEEERQQILSGQGFSIIDFQKNPKIEVGYLYNWLWMIYSSLLRRIDPSWVFEGKEILEDLKNLLRVTSETKIKAFDELSVKKVAAKAKMGIKVPFVTVDLAADIEAVRETHKDKLPFEIIQIVERYISKISINPSNRVMLFFDELELFWSKSEQKERDLALIRDLIISVSRANHVLSPLGAATAIYACVRSEVLEEINQISPELARDVEDFSVSVNWNVKADADLQPILNIVEAKINVSEIEMEEHPTERVWDTYFPENFYGKKPKNYLLDVSMFKPRLMIMRLNQAKLYDPECHFFSEDSIEESSTEFSRLAWREISEQMLQYFSPRQIDNLRNIISGWKPIFTLDELEIRVSDLNIKSPGVIDGFSSRFQINKIFSHLYANGAVGNRYNIEGAHKAQSRDRWSFRGYSDCAFDKPFVVHESLRKYFQLPF